MIVILLGLPASAKSTHGKTISEVFGLNIIAPGFLLRQIALQNKQIRECLSQGLLVDEEISNKIVQEELKKQNYQCIIDGYPRTITQAQSLSEFLKENKNPDIIVINIKISTEESIKRLSVRYSCKKCNISYDQKTVCCQIETEKREDDNVDIIQDRVMKHLCFTKPVEDYYKELGVLIDLDGSVNIEEEKLTQKSPKQIVSERLVVLLKNFFKNRKF